jgi:hypothetical protein
VHDVQVRTVVGTRSHELGRPFEVGVLHETPMGPCTLSAENSVSMTEWRAEFTVVAFLATDAPAPQLSIFACSTLQVSCLITTSCFRDAWVQYSSI